jgi:hypothetical protein
VTYTPDANFNGAASFEYQVCDNGNTNGSPDPQCADGVVNVTVNPVNDAPVSEQPVSDDQQQHSCCDTAERQRSRDLPAADLVFEVTVSPAHGRACQAAAQT